MKIQSIASETENGELNYFDAYLYIFCQHLLQLILMKRGGQVIYSGELGQNSSKLIKYFEVSSKNNSHM